MGVHRLGKEVHSAALHTRADILLMGIRCDEHHRQIGGNRVVLDGVQHIKAGAPPFQAEIQQHCAHLFRVFPEVLHALCGVGNALHMEQVLEDLIENGPVQFRVINNQQCITDHTSASSARY